MKIAIIGLNPHTQDDIPWDDAEWKTWGLGWGGGKTKYLCDRLFDIHDPSLWKGGDEYLDNLLVLDAEIVLQGNYPLKEAVETFGDYLQSSMAYMMGEAIMSNPDEIKLFGCDPGGPWAYQRPNLEYFIGFARGRGIKVTIAEGSRLCQYDPQPLVDSGGPFYPVRYGWI